jgi:hypothetical protein
VARRAAAAVVGKEGQGEGLAGVSDSSAQGFAAGGLVGWDAEAVSGH